MKRFLALTLAIASLLGLFGPLQIATAADGADFRAGRIIDDSVFMNKAAMSVSQIQTFLNTKLPTCNPNHAEDTSNWRDMGPPYRCLKDYKENSGVAVRNCTKAEIQSYFGFGPADSRYTAALDYCWWKDGRANLKGQAVSANAKTAAQIIWQAAQDYDISPQVLLVMLQKEQSLITDDWPWVGQYQKALGYACPDSGGCDPSRRGFYNQIRSAASQFNLYATNPDDYNHKAGVNNNILYHPNTACGTKKVLIENQATAGLYNYTPYTPNPAALNNLYGTGNSCSSYGNRNFWRLFTDWFGSTFGSSNVYRLKSSASGGIYLWTASVSERNTADANGYTNQGTAFNAYRQNSVPNLFPVYRLYNSVTKDHHYTTSPAERDRISEWPSFKYEGVAFYVFKAAGNGQKLVYRMRNPRNGRHFFTARVDERDDFKAAGWTNEGAAWYAPL